MKTKFALVVGVIVMSTVLGWTVHAQKQDSQKVSWQYAVISFSNSVDAKWKLDELGNEGWELVSVTETTNGSVTIYVKRAK
jgi:predicted negative regulator of RcsB-dependent stress response